MTDNTKMVDLPWADGTTRTVPEGTVYEARYGLVYAARVDGYSNSLSPGYGKWTYPHCDDSAAVRIFTEAPEPPVKVNVPTGLGAIVSLPDPPHNPGYVLTRGVWLGLRTRVECDPDGIANMLRAGSRVLYEGVDKDTP